MKIPTISGTIACRILLNYRVEPSAIVQILPENFRPKLISGFAIAGICMIRLEKIRPDGMPSFIGQWSENSAHRIAVEWDEGDEVKEGVFVPRRDTNSPLTALAGGRIFPGMHHLSRFTISDSDSHISIRVDSRDSEHPLIDARFHEIDKIPGDSIFPSLEESSRFFENGCIGYSSRTDSCLLDGLWLEIDEWQVTPLHIEHARSAYFDDQTLFPPGTIEIDHALLMRDIPHKWHSEKPMIAD